MSLPPYTPWPRSGTGTTKHALRAYLSQDGAIMLADPALGGGAPCDPTPDQAARRTPDLDDAGNAVRPA